MDILDVIVHIIFISLGILAMGDYLRYRDGTRRDVALMFGTLAVPFLFQLIARIQGKEVSAGAQMISVIALVLEPYLLLRLVRYLRSMPSYMMRLAGYGLIITVLIGILVNERIPLITTLVSQGYLIGFNLYAMVGFARAVRQAAGVQRQRLRFASAGSGLFATIFLVTLLSNAVPLPEDFALLALEVLAGACAITYYISFTPPRWLRQSWQLRELHNFLRQVSSGNVSHDTHSIVNELAGSASRAVGAVTTVIALCDAGGKRLAIEVPGEPPLHVGNMEDLPGAVGQAWRERKARMANIPGETSPEVNEWGGQFGAQALLIVPILSSLRPWGMLIVALRHAPLFPQDDIELLKLFVEQSAISLDFSALIAETERAGEERYHRVLDNMLEGGQIIGFDWRYLYINDAVIRQGHQTREGLLGRTMMEVYPGIENTELFAVLQKCMSGRTVHHMENEFAYPDGSSGWFELSIQPVDEGVFILSMDITQRKRAEQALRESEDQFRQAVTESPMPMLIHDEDDRNHFISKGWTKYSGYTLEDIPTMPDWTQKAYGTGSGIAKEYIDNLFTINETIGNGEWTITAKNGEKRIWDFYTTPIGKMRDGKRLLMSMAVDVTERTHAEEEIRKLNIELEQRVVERTAQLQESEEKFSKAFLNSPAAVSIASLPDGRYINVNDALAKLTGYSREELLGHTSTELGLVDSTARARIIEVTQKYGSARNVEIQIRTKSNQIADVLTSIEQIEVGGQPCMLSVNYDITERKQAEAKVRELNQALEQRQTQLEAANKELEAFSYSVSHDLRAPLRSIDGFSQALLEDYGGQIPEQGQNYLNRVRNAAQRMAELIDDMLDLSRVSRAPMQSGAVDLSAIAEKIVNELRQTDPARNAAVSIAEGIVVNGDAALLRVVLVNLLSNAWKFTSKKESAQIEFGVQNDGEKRAFFVRDNGAGFDMTYADKLFGAFQRLHKMDDFPGTGVGLATVKRIITRHGGQIWAESTLGEGATFYFTLP